MLDGARTFIVHADTNQDFNAADFEIRVFGDFLEVVDHAVLKLKDFEVGSIGDFGVVVYTDVRGDSFCVFAKRNLLLVNSLLIDSRAHVNI